MKTIGLLGGMSWESTVSYYRALNEGIKARLGGLHSAKICLHSVDFAEIEPLQRSGDWDETARLLSAAARSVEAAGADFLLIGTNTMHKVAPQIEAAISIPLLHIADATAERLQDDGIARVGLIGTRYTMEQDFYKGRMAERFGLDVRVPNADEQAVIHRVIFEELCQGIIRDDSRDAFLKIIQRLYEAGAEAVILGCTEIALLVGPEDTGVPLYDTTRIHAEQAVERALAG
ncbi:aspartate/glutamate racemase family protein [Marinobacter mangrovi]|uniref:aspartate/glutamate racemase family protein n=1 Tax=Marinobacter mangrovi TaxID=2803918 RepID=UPI0019331B69|nr:aspartate/glutamate racemase family protein [Marinobacter mangrovi]